MDLAWPTGSVPGTLLPGRNARVEFAMPSPPGSSRPKRIEPKCSASLHYRWISPTKLATREALSSDAGCSITIKGRPLVSRVSVTMGAWMLPETFPTLPLPLHQTEAQITLRLLSSSPSLLLCSLPYGVFS